MHSASVGPLTKRSLTERAARMLLAGIALVLFLSVIAIAVIYFLVQGKAGEGSAISNQIQSQLEAIVGPDYHVRMGQSDIDLSNIGQVAVVAKDITILQKSDQAMLSRIGQIEIGGSLIEFFSGELGLDRVRILDAELDAGVMPSGQGLAFPSHLRLPLDAAGKFLAKLHSTFEKDGFKIFEVDGLVISGPVLLRRHTDPILIETITAKSDQDGRLVVDGRATTQLSNISFKSVYDRLATEKAAASYAFQVDGISLMEWMDDPASESGNLGGDSKVSISTDLFFDENNSALDPKMNVRVSSGTLRVGLLRRTDIHDFDVNLRVFLDKNQIELDPSILSAGRLNARLVGGIRPVDKGAGYHGSLQYDLIMKRGEFQPTVEGEAILPAAFKFAGVYNRVDRLLSMNQIVMTTHDGSISGEAVLGFEDVSPYIKASAQTNGISVIALKQFWPFFVANGARKWVHSHVFEGRAVSGSLEADIPAGVIFNLQNGATLSPDQYKVTLDLEAIKFKPFGDLPPIENAKGSVKLEGMQVLANLSEGSVDGGGKKPVQTSNGNFLMENFAASERWADTTLEIDGDIGSIARILDHNPLRVMQRMKVEANQFSGSGHANVAVRFPVGRKAEFEEVDWNVLLDLTKGASNKKLSGRKLTHADILIDANPSGAKVTGSMRIDGISSRVNFVEPVGKSGKVKRLREVTTVLDEKGRKALGVNLAPVVTGAVDVKVVQKAGVESYRLDFKNAELNLPWAGWLKGKGIPARAEFNLKRLKSGVKLENFSIKGDGFFGTGALQMDKKGLRSAELPGFKLNESDDMSLKLERSGNGYNINISGLSYDSRGLLNALIHQGGFTSAQGGRSVNLVANFATVRGFGNRVIRNAVLLYESQAGRLKVLDLRGEGSDGRRYNVQAQLNGNDTLFTVNTNDAGTALAFTDIYTRMEGGLLEAKLIQGEGGPYRGPVRITKFDIVNEPRLKRMASSVRQQIPESRGDRQRIIPDAGDKRIKFTLADAQIERGPGYFNVNDAIIRSTSMGIAMEGVVYDPKDRMSLTGTFMPANGLNLAVSAIPILGQLLSNGKDKALIGITYKLRGPRKDPELTINPLSIVTPGVFNRVFEFR